MVKNISIKTEKVDCNLSELTQNTVIFCSNLIVKNCLSAEIGEYIQNKLTNDGIDGLRTTIYCLKSGQKITITTERGLMLTVSKPEDVWFSDMNNKGIVETWAFTDFIGYKMVWKQGLLTMLKSYVVGVFGAMEGEY